jgi:hypothetical protein
MAQLLKLLDEEIDAHPRQQAAMRQLASALSSPRGSCDHTS